MGKPFKFSPTLSARGREECDVFIGKRFSSLCELREINSRLRRYYFIIVIARAAILDLRALTFFCFTPSFLFFSPRVLRSVPQGWGGTDFGFYPLVSFCNFFLILHHFLFFSQIITSLVWGHCQENSRKRLTYYVQIHSGWIRPGPAYFPCAKLSLF